MIDLEKIKNIPTPFYYYDAELLERTLDAISCEISKDERFRLHYAIKANANPDVIARIASRGFGADCVSGWEIQRCIETGFNPSNIVFAGVAKTDWEIKYALEVGIGSFNVESIQELEVISQLAQQLSKEANIALRINPNVGAHTHANIATGLSENKFGIDMVYMLDAINIVKTLPNLHLVGLHFHIGSQILCMDDFIALCHRINELQEQIEAEGITDIQNINVGGGLGIDYENPDENPIPDFKAYFETYRTHLKLRPHQKLHFELGRAVVGQMGSLITSIIYVKSNAIKNFAIVDAGFTDLIRPALYGAYHKIENLTPQNAQTDVYDIVGPICESTDVFATGYQLPKCNRGDLIALRSAGAYGEIMASQYNCRPLPKGYLL